MHFPLNYMLLKAKAKVILHLALEKARGFSSHRIFRLKKSIESTGFLANSSIFSVEETKVPGQAL